MGKWKNLRSVIVPHVKIKLAGHNQGASEIVVILLV